MKPKCEESLSNFAFNCNLRHYTKAGTLTLPPDSELNAVMEEAAVKPVSVPIPEVRRCSCSFTPGTPWFSQLTPRLLSGTLRHSQALSGTLRHSQALSGTFRALQLLETKT